MKRSILTWGLILSLALSGCKNQPLQNPDDKAPSHATEAPVAPPDGHTSRIALDWPGTYADTVPCADCPGIKMLVELTRDERYRFWYQFMEKSDSVYREEGRFTWQENGSVIRTSADSLQSTGYFKVAENRLIMLDQEGNPIEGSLKEKYELPRWPAQLEGVHWRLQAMQNRPFKPVAGMRERPYLLIEGERVSGYSGCNRYSGKVNISGDQLQLGPVASTRMACQGGADRQEQEYLETLSQVKRYQLAQDRLLLTDSAGTALLEYQAWFF